MLPSFSGVEFLRTVSKYRKRKRKSLSCVPVLDKTWNEALSRCSRAVTNKPIAFLPFSLPSPPSLCRREAGEKEKRNKKARGVWWEGRRDPVRFLFFFFFFFFFVFFFFFFFFFFFGFFIGIPSGASAKERGVVWFGSSVLGVSEGPYRHQHCLKFRLF